MAQISESIYVGSLVELEGKQGQVLDYKPETGKCSVALVEGGTTTADAAKLTVPKAMAAPGLGGADKSFDVLIGPSEKVGGFADLISTCLFEKGFCVLRVCQAEEERTAAHAYMMEMADEGKLQRLATEVEEGYLGGDAKGKIAWLDPDSDDSPTDPFLLSADQFFSELMSALLPYNHNCLGKLCEQRTTGLVSLALEGSEDLDFPNPIPEDKALGDFLKIWRRGHLRGVQFMGPSNAIVSLRCQTEDSLPVAVNQVDISATPGTLLLFRPSIYKYTVAEPGNTLSLSVTFMEQEQQLVLGTPGDLSVLGDMYPGPSPPSGGHAIVHNCAARLPACWDSAEGYTGSLAVGCDAVVEFPKTRFDWEFYYNPDTATAEPWQLLLKHFSMCEGLEMFDNKYFSIPAQEAIAMGPMQRHLLETGAMNLAQMGITKKVADREPKHAGCSVGLDKDDWNLVPKENEAQQGGNNVIAIISNRFSFSFNMKGCNYVADTACSASLCATHFARLMMSDRTYDVLEFFVCMGIHNCLSVLPFIGGGQSHMFSITGRCATFNDTADGYQRGDGCSGLVLKWATHDSDESMAVWRGSMTGQNGRSATLTAPNGLSQEDVCWKAIREAKAKPGECSVWSCHGTGTSLGDPIEIGAVRKIHKGARENQLVMNTNKTNVGHLEGGAAMTSLISAVYQVKMMKANPTNHLRQFNAHIVTEGFDASWFNELGNWGPDRQQGHAHVSSFGFGGTNAHCVFWGRNLVNVPDAAKLYRKRLFMMAPPEVRPIGNNPADWEHDLPDLNILPGDVYSIPILKDDPVDAPIRYVKEEEGFEEGVMESDTAYCIMGNYNEWAPEDMDVGNVPGLRTSYIQVPDSGRIEFNFCKSVEEGMILAPAYDQCTRKTAKVEGPAEGLTNKWVAVGVPGSSMRIDLFASHGLITVSWLPVGGGVGKSSVLDLLADL